jgi:quercetin dioxygenase-like cupin family protein
MHYVGRVDWSSLDTPLPASPDWSGLSRVVLVGLAQGAVHTELAIGSLAPGGWLARHVHSFEEVLYVLAGELLVELDGRAYRLGPGDYAAWPVGVWHGLANRSSEPARWLSVNTPQRLPLDGPRKDTFFAAESFDPAALEVAARRPPIGDPTLRYIGHYEGTPPIGEVVIPSDPARGRRPAGADTALIVYSGISVKMLADRVFGLDLLTMFTVDYEPGGAAQAHDHPFEETYFFLAGETSAQIDGQPYTLRAGDVVFAGVGAVHGFWNEGTERVRWIETQAPQPPARHAYRWVASWERPIEGRS